MSMQAHTDAHPLAPERAETDGRSRKPILVRILLALQTAQQRKADEFIWRHRHLMPALAFASLAMTISAMAQGQAVQFARECALKEIAAITVIEDHGVAEDPPADWLGNARLTMLRALLS
jgi:hypothetical protein